MTSTKPSPATFTLRFKNHRTTTFLHADPLQSFDSLKEELLRALRESHPDGILNKTQIPADPSQVFLARPNDIHNLDSGFTSLADKAGALIAGSEADGRRKKTSETEVKLKEATPKAAGLANGSVVAYKFVTDEDEEYNPVTDEQWDVVMPKYEEQE
ncbi:MAG: hypothetical protein Q9162_006317 [Coniocarpon cinnabarinum]